MQSTTPQSLLIEAYEATTKKKFWQQAPQVALPWLQREGEKEALKP
jgi:hypothetical protein